MRAADVSSLRMLRMARDRIDRDYADQMARDRIDRDYADQIGFPALAAGAGYSREHVIRAVRRVYGERRRPSRVRGGASGHGGQRRAVHVA